ncbi:hypothetical protein HU153_00955 [Metamycoplasma hominis]|uniref:hypothetical protein n=1 Tax=Metamycoplasma hominis TaxID=2098 RepID=UPI0015943832|nr:hypothetical protein [Metamycoplasma hominis]QKX36552.1 hypothetical protein HU153_00955 [Metamycoplasma hominis]
MLKNKNIWTLIKQKRIRKYINDELNNQNTIQFKKKQNKIDSFSAIKKNLYQLKKFKKLEMQQIH